MDSSNIKIKRKQPMRDDRPDRHSAVVVTECESVY